MIPPPTNVRVTKSVQIVAVNGLTVADIVAFAAELAGVQGSLPVSVSRDAYSGRVSLVVNNIA